MNDKLVQNKSLVREESANIAEEDETLVELRHLLIGPVEVQVDNLQTRLDDPELRSREVGFILPEAITIRSSQDDALVTALSPTVEQAVRFSIRNNLKSFADALFPVIGPAIRKSISEALKGMVQSLNEAIDKSFSFKGLKWRIEAYRTKKPFSEIILLHSIIYRVEQLFLIHKKTGLLLKHIVKEEIEFQDADMVSGMLTAIRDFVADSFHIDDEYGLDSIRVGELDVWIEHGPEAILALVVRGNAPATLRSTMKETLEKIHLEFGNTLESFEGDTEVFEDTAYVLESCLVSLYKEAKKKTSPLLMVGLTIGVAGIALWIWLSLKDYLKWQEFLEVMNNQEGIVITKAEKEDGKYIIRGLRDILAIEPVEIVTQLGIDPGRVRFYWTPYQALTDSMVLKRARKALEADDSIELTLDHGNLSAKGQVTFEWLKNAQSIARNIPGITNFEVSGLTITNKQQLDAFQNFVKALTNEKGVIVTSTRIENGILHLSGLLDPFATDPKDMLKSLGLDQSTVVFNWEPYQSGDLPIILKRAKKILSPPDTISFGIKDNCLSVSGVASSDWLLELKRWIKTIPGTPCLDESGFVNLEFKMIEEMKRKIESENILFKTDTPTLAKGQLEILEKVAQEIIELKNLSEKLHLPLKIVISGHTDMSGTEERNKKLSQLRADKIREFFVSQGLKPNMFLTEALGSSRPISTDKKEAGLEINRRASFQIIDSDNL